MPTGPPHLPMPALSAAPKSTRNHEFSHSTPISLSTGGREIKGSNLSLIDRLCLISPVCHSAENSAPECCLEQTPVSLTKGLSSRRCFTQLRHLLPHLRQKVTRLASDFARVAASFARPWRSFAALAAKGDAPRVRLCPGRGIFCPTPAIFCRTRGKR